MPRGWCRAGCWPLLNVNLWSCSRIVSSNHRQRAGWAILSLNKNRMAFLMRSVKPDIIFLQECTLKDTNLNARAANLFNLLLSIFKKAFNNVIRCIIDDVKINVVFVSGE
jgi:hypothetical protein